MTTTAAMTTYRTLESRSTLNAAPVLWISEKRSKLSTTSTDWPGAFVSSDSASPLLQRSSATTTAATGRMIGSSDANDRRLGGLPVLGSDEFEANSLAIQVALPAVALAFQTWLERERYGFRAHRRTVWLELAGHAFVADVNAIRDVKPGCLAQLVDLAAELAGLALGQQSRRDGGVQGNNNVLVAGDLVALLAFEAHEDLLRSELHAGGAESPRRKGLHLAGFDGRPDIAQLGAQLGPQQRQVDAVAPLGKALGPCLLDALDVQLLEHQILEVGGPVGIQRDLERRQRLAHLDLRSVTRCQAELDHAAHQRHLPFQLAVDKPGVDLGITAVVDARVGRRVHAADQVLIHLLGHERQDRRHQFGQRD